MNREYNLKKSFSADFILHITLNKQSDRRSGNIPSVGHSAVRAFFRIIVSQLNPLKLDFDFN